MKMMPGADGTTLNLNDRESVTLTETFNLSGTNVEEFDDLSVVVLFQEFSSKEIFQSEYSIEEGSFATEASCTELTYNGMPVPGFSPDVFTYEIELPVGTTEVPEVTGTAADPNATMVVVPAWALPGTTVVDVFGEDLVSRNTYNINFSVEVGIGEPEANDNVKIFPNPAKDRIYFQGAERADVRFFNITGQLVLDINGVNSNSIDISSLEKGIYTVQIRTKNGSVVNKKFTVIK